MTLPKNPKAEDLPPPSRHETAAQMTAQSAESVRVEEPRHDDCIACWYWAPCSCGCPACQPLEVTHRCPPKGSGVMPCCGRTPFEVPTTHRMTLDESLVTCALIDGADARHVSVNDGTLDDLIYKDHPAQFDGSSPIPPCDLHNDPACPWCGDEPEQFDGSACAS